MTTQAFIGQWNNTRPLEHTAPALRNSKQSSLRLASQLSARLTAAPGWMTRMNFTPASARNFPVMGNCWRAISMAQPICTTPGSSAHSGKCPWKYSSAGGTLNCRLSASCERSTESICGSRITRPASGRMRQQRLDCVDDVADGTHVLEGMRLDLASRELLELQDQIDRIDAVDIEVGVQVGFRHDLLGLQLEQLHQDLPQVGQDFFARFDHHGHFYILAIEKSGAAAGSVSALSGHGIRPASKCVSSQSVRRRAAREDASPSRRNEAEVTGAPTVTCM